MSYSTARGRPRLYTIPPDVDFLPAMARAMLDGHLPCPRQQRPAPESLADWRIFLPSRRAARGLAAALLEAAPAQSQILARITPLGDPSEDELALTEEAGLEALQTLPPPIHPLTRRFVLARLVRDWAGKDRATRLSAIIRAHPGEAMKMARSLGELIDSFENEQIDFSAIETLLDAEQPEHRLAARQLLRAIRDGYPEELAKLGLMGAAARRAALIRLQAQNFRANPPSAPVIAAGSTGSMPATAHLLATIARLPQGCVILPGLDREMDDAAWQALEPSHPQYGLKALLEHMGADRHEVEDLPAISRPAHGPARTRLLSLALRPAAVTGDWHGVLATCGASHLKEGAEGLNLISAADQRQEAACIALIMRDALRQPRRTATLITPDRELARQVRAELARWNLDVNDSAGLPLSATPPGAFVRLLAEAALERFAPQMLAAVLAHPLACFGFSRRDFSARAQVLEAAVLRQVDVFAGIDTLPAIVRRRRKEAMEAPWREHRATRAVHDHWDMIEETAAVVSRALSPLQEAFAARDGVPLEELVRRHLGTAEAIATPEEGASGLWRGQAGEALAALCADLLDNAAAAPPFEPAGYAAFLAGEMAARPVRPPQATHPRLSILGLLEARLVGADVTILGGLNEGVWPQVAENSPWLNRPDCEKLRLPVPERRIGLSAHDFAQAAARREVWLTLSEKTGQQPAEPSRWILRLQALLKAAGAGDSPMEAGAKWRAWAGALNQPERMRGPVAPPAPCPPVGLRPRSFSVSRIATLMHEPYAVFARDILRLDPMPPLTARVTPREKGLIIHAALEAYARAHPAALPRDAQAAIMESLKTALADVLGEDARGAFWLAQFARMAAWLAAQERIWRKDARFIRAERSARMELSIGGEAFVLTARADRIDELADGRCRLMDYKTGVLPAVRADSKSYSPQLDLEAAMLARGLFEDTPKAEVAELLYVRLSGGDPAGEIRALNTPPPPRRAKDALAGARALLAQYMDPAQPYLPLDHGARERLPHDFDHLSRWREWTQGLAGRTGEDKT